MLDNMTIKCYDEKATKHFTSDFFESKYGMVERIGVNEYSFKLYNPDNKTSSFLRIECPHLNCKGEPVCLEITGSIRKWWFGNKSTKDFSKQEYSAAINLLFEILEIPQKWKKNFIISKVEVGMNIYVKQPCSEILNRVTEYRSSCYLRHSHPTGIAFKAKSKEIKLYDKIEEISKKFKKKSIKDVEESQFLENNKDKNLLRIEFKINCKSELGFNNLEDSIIFFDDLYFYFWKKLRYIKYNNNELGEFTGKNYKDFLKYLAYVGIDSLETEIFEKMIKQLNKNAKREARKLYETSSTESCSYNKFQFFRDIKIQMLYSMKESRNLYLVKELFLKKQSA